MGVTIRNIGARSILDLVTSLVVITASSMLIYRTIAGPADGARPELQVPSAPVSLDRTAIRGSRDAEVVMIIYSDFQCPFCSRFTRETLPEIERRYVATGKVALAFWHLPLPMHPDAVDAAVVAECAGQQGRFWEMHDLLFALDKVDQDALLTLTDQLDLERARFEECRADRGVREHVQASAKQANALGIRSTPTFFFGKRLEGTRANVSRALSGARPVDDFIEQLEATLSAKPSRWRRLFSLVASSLDGLFDPGLEFRDAQKAATIPVIRALAAGAQLG